METAFLFAEGKLTQSSNMSRVLRTTTFLYHIINNTPAHSGILNRMTDICGSNTNLLP